MSATVAPPQRSDDELEALIEEARRHARRRRLGHIRAAALAVILAGGVLAGLSALEVIGGSGGTTNPRGFHVVRSRGPVEHRLIQTSQLPQPTTIDLETGEQRAAATTTEIWLDRRSGLARIVERLDGSVQSDRTTANSGPLPAGARLTDFINMDSLFGTYWPVDRRTFGRQPGLQTFRGHKVIWLGSRIHGFPPVPKDGNWLALDARTHQPVGYRSFLYGTVVQEALLKARLPDIPRGRFSFTVPDEQPETPAWRAPKTIATTAAKRMNRVARRTLGRTPLWLGRRFRGHGLRSVSIGSEPAAGTGRAAPFVLFDYGVLGLKEFEARRPAGHLEGPRSGRIVLQTVPSYTLAPGPDVRPKVVVSEQSAALTRGGLLVIATSGGDRRIALDRSTSLDLAAALRPISP